MQGWNESNNDIERFLTVYYISQQQGNLSDKLEWLQSTLKFALKVNDNSVNSTLSSLYVNILKGYEDLNDKAKANKYAVLSSSCKKNPSDKGPFIMEQKLI